MKTSEINWKQMPNGKEKYRAYLASREWALKKKAVHLRSGGKCERCITADGENVHHQTYHRIYNEDLKDLLHVCIPCHQFLSGVSDHDPLNDRPLLFMGKAVKDVYLAGKMKNWRDEICEGWSSFKQHEGKNGLYEWELFLDFFCNGRIMRVTGPYISPSIVDGTKNRHVDDSSLPHLSNGDHFTFDENIVHRIKRAIKASDLVFAWIDSEDCFGTLLEIGYAVGIGKPVIVYRGRVDEWCPYDNSSSKDELWLCNYFAIACGSGFTSAGQAWNHFSDKHLI